MFATQYTVANPLSQYRPGLNSHLKGPKGKIKAAKAKNHGINLSTHTRVDGGLISSQAKGDKLKLELISLLCCDPRTFLYRSKSDIRFEEAKYEEMRTISILSIICYVQISCS